MAMVFFYLLSLTTRTMTAHRAGSQLKILKKWLNIKFILFLSGWEPVLYPHSSVTRSVSVPANMLNKLTLVAHTGCPKKN